MLPLLAIQLLLIAVSGGLAKPYCSWQEEANVCLETADTASPRNASEFCADETYTQLILDIKYCLSKQEPTFTGCIAGTDENRCEAFQYAREEQLISAHLGGVGLNGRLCLPRDRTADQDTAPAETAVKSRTDLLRTLTAVNICEGRGKDVAMSTQEVKLTISAPCTCRGSNIAGPFNASDAQLCSALTVLPDAAKQCEACNNDWDTWLNDYLRKGECRPTAWAAAPIQAFCRAAQTQAACMKVNDDCGSQCGGDQPASPEAAGGTPEAPDDAIDNTSTIPDMLQKPPDIDSGASTSSAATQKSPSGTQAEPSASADMSAAHEPSAGIPAAAAAAAATMLFAARGL